MDFIFMVLHYRYYNDDTGIVLIEDNTKVHTVEVTCPKSYFC